MKFSTGVRGLTVGSKLLFRYKKYLFDKSKKMDQSGLDQLRAEEASSRTSDDEDEDQNKEVDRGDGDSGSSNNHHDGDNGYANESGLVETPREELAAGEKTLQENQKDTSAERADMSDRAVVVSESVTSTTTLAAPLPTLSPPPPQQQPESTSVVTSVSAPAPIVRTTFTPLSTLLSKISVTSASNNTAATSGPSTGAPTTVPVSDSTGATSVIIQYPAGTSAQTHLVREGIIESTKIEETSEIVTVKGAFRMEENIRLHIGAVAVSQVLVNNSYGVGSVVGPFGKMGKCKVKFEAGQAGAVGDTVRIFTGK